MTVDKNKQIGDLRSLTGKQPEVEYDIRELVANREADTARKNILDTEGLPLSKRLTLFQGENFKVNEYNREFIHLSLIHISEPTRPY